MLIFWSTMMTRSAATPPQAIIFTTGDQTVPAYSEQAMVTVRSDDQYNEAPLLLRWEISADRVRAVMFAGFGCGTVPADPFVECSFATRPATQVLQLKLPALAPGVYTLEATNYDGQITKADQTRTLTVLATPPVVNVASIGTAVRVVFGSQFKDGKFFISALESEVASLVSVPGGGIVGPTWAVAEPITLRAWPAAGPSADIAKPVCRLYHPTLVTHFFSASASDCATVRATPPWRDEGIAFRALIPDAGGVCPIGTEPVWRLYSSKFQTHHYTRSNTTYTGFKANGWTPEGVVFCSAPG